MRPIAVDRDDQALQQAFAGDGVIPWTADLRRDGAALAREILNSQGEVDLLVNNVGVDRPSRFLELEQEEFDAVFQTNLRGPWFLTRELARAMVERAGGGSIVFVSSLHDTFPRGHPHYSASKAAVTMLVRELAEELGPYGIRVNSVSPGVIVSAHVPADKSDDAQIRSRRLIPLGRKGEPIDIARIVSVLLSEQWSSYVTGANIRVDGGLGAHSWSFDEP